MGGAITASSSKSHLPHAHRNEHCQLNLRSLASGLRIERCRGCEGRFAEAAGGQPSMAKGMAQDAHEVADVILGGRPREARCRRANDGPAHPLALRIHRGECEAPGSSSPGSYNRFASSLSPPTTRRQFLSHLQFPTHPPLPAPPSHPFCFAQICSSVGAMQEAEKLVGMARASCWAHLAPNCHVYASLAHGYCDGGLRKQAYALLQVGPTCMHTYMHVCARTCVHARTHTYIHAHVHTCAHMCIHT